MTLLSKLEQKFGRWAIPNVTVLIIAGQVGLYFMQRMGPQDGLLADPTKLWLLPGQVFAGEIWRLLTFVICPPMIGFFVIFYWMLMYIFGSALEQVWGTFRYNCYLLVAYMAIALASLAIWAWGGDMAVISAQVTTMALGFGLVNTSVFLYSSLFLGFARINPDFTLNLYFLLPIKIKWLAMLQWIAYGYVLLSGNWPVRALVLASVLNYFVFFGREHWREYKHGQRRRSYQAKAATVEKQIRHVCLVCGLNSKDSPRTLFRYCSKCDGQCCYCPEHIQDHEHVTSTEADEATVS